MPHLKIRGIDKNLIIENSKELVDGLAEIIQCSRDYFTIEHISTDFIFDGKVTQGSNFSTTFVEIYWFDRDKTIKHQTAEFITSFIKKLNSNRDCNIIFHPLTGENYCDNWEFFG